MLTFGPLRRPLPRYRFGIQGAEAGVKGKVNGLWQAYREKALVWHPDKNPDNREAGYLVS